MRSASSLAMSVTLLFVLFAACNFNWDFYDPRGSTGGGQATGGQSASTSSAATGGGGGLDCPAGTGDCDGDRATGCEADLTSDSHCGACNVVCTPGGCASSFSETFAAPNASWQYNGSAYHDAVSGSAVLTDAIFSVAGSAFYLNAIVTDSFTASFEAQISDSPAGAGGGGGGGGGLGIPGDGLAFGLQTGGPTALGGPGGGLGLSGLDGFGFELDTYDNERCGDPVFEHAAVMVLTACGTDMDPTPVQVSGALAVPLPETGWHLVEIEFQAGMASMRLDTAEVVGAVSVPGFTSGKPYFYGFGAGTGGAVNRHEVRNLTIQFPTPRCL